MVVAGYLFFLITLAVIMLWHPLKTQLDLIRAVALAMGLFLYLCAPGYLAWYLIWFLPFAAMSGSRWLIWGALAFTITAFLPILALNWGASIRASWSIGNPVEWAVVVAWLCTAAAAAVGASTGRTPRARKAGTAGPRFAPRQKRRARH